MFFEYCRTRELKALTNIVVAAVQDRLVATHILRNKVQRLNDPQTKLLALLVLCDSNIFDVADEAEVVDATAAI